MGSPTSVIALLLVRGVLAAPAVRVEAEVASDLAHVHGVLRWEGDIHFVDALARLPDPPDDRSALRAWPRAPQRGEVIWREGEDAEGRFLAFEAHLPDRYGACGRVPGQGLFASGLWLAQPVAVDGRVPVVAWEATVHQPDGAVGALGSVVGEGTLRGAGEGDLPGYPPSCRNPAKGAPAGVWTSGVEGFNTGRAAGA